MSSIISRNRFCFSPYRTNTGTSNNSRCKILSMREEKSKSKPMEKSGGSAGLTNLCFVLCAIIIFCGAFYLYQVNDLATKGYEMKDVENRIATLEKENKKMQIKEVELRSMYNLEKATADIDLVNSQNVTYLQMASPVAMK